MKETVATGAVRAALAWDREHRFPAEAIREMGELGFMGMLVPEEWGGSDTGQVAYAMAIEEIAAGDGACSTIMSVHNSVGCAPIHKYGSDEQKERYLKPLARGQWLGRIRHLRRRRRRRAGAH